MPWTLDAADSNPLSRLIFELPCKSPPATIRRVRLWPAHRDCTESLGRTNPSKTRTDALCAGIGNRMNGCNTRQRN